jgi:hypothetical protein
MLDRSHSQRRSTEDPYIWQCLLENLHARVGDLRVNEVEIRQSGQSLQVRDYSVIDTMASKPKGVKVRQLMLVADLLLVDLRPGEFDRDDTMDEKAGATQPRSLQAGYPHAEKERRHSFRSRSFVAGAISA